MELVIALTVIFLCITLIVCTVILVYAIKQLHPEVKLPTIPQVFHKGSPDNVSGQYNYENQVPIDSFMPDFKREVKVQFEDKYDAKDNG